MDTETWLFPRKMAFRKTVDTLTNRILDEEFDFSENRFSHESMKIIQFFYRSFLHINWIVLYVSRSGR